MIKVNLLRNRGTQGSSTQADYQTAFDTQFESPGTGASSGSNKDSIIKIIVMLAGAVLLYLFEAYHIDSLRSELAVESKKLQIIQAEAQEKRPLAEKAKKMQEEIKTLETRIQKVKDLSKFRLREIRIIDFIQNIIPDRVWLMSIKINPEGLFISGATLSIDQMNKFTESLESKSYFKNATILKSVEQKTKDGTIISFDLTAEITMLE